MSHRYSQVRLAGFQVNGTDADPPAPSGLFTSSTARQARTGVTKVGLPPCTGVPAAVFSCTRTGTVLPARNTANPAPAPNQRRSWIGGENPSNR